jgi:NADH-quinone oxidoreductase subunit G
MSVNNEGRAQHYYRALPGSENIGSSWRWIRDIAIEAGKNEFANWKGTEEIITALGEEIPVFKDALKSYPSRGLREDGQQIPRQTRRFSGRTAMLANVTISEPKPPQDSLSPYAFSMEGFNKPLAPMATFYWAPGWNSVQALNKYQEELCGDLKGGKPEGIRLLPENSTETAKFYTEIPKEFVPSDGELAVVNIWHIFGSAELASQSQAMAEVSPEASIYLSPEESEKLKLKEGDSININWSKGSATLKLKVLPGLPKGVSGISAGVKGTPFIEPLTKVKISK